MVRISPDGFAVLGIDNYTVLAAIQHAAKGGSLSCPQLVCQCCRTPALTAIVIINQLSQLANFAMRLAIQLAAGQPTWRIKFHIRTASREDISMKTRQTLLQRYLKDVKPGTLSWIGLRPERKAPLTVVTSVMALKDMGLEGDHRCAKKPGSGRQVTLISEEYIQQIEHFTGKQSIHPELLRRNLVVKNINLSTLRHQQFAIGDAIFEANALCDPCSRMEQALGKGGFIAMLGHGGLCARIIQGGIIRTGDSVKLITAQGELF
jgi:MOSC domain-containing protein YiiM